MKRVVGISEIVLWADDLAAMVEWYRDFLGLEQLSPPERPGPVFLKVGDGAAGIPQMIVLTPKPEALRGQAGAPQLHHLALTLPPEQFDAQRGAFLARGQAVRRGQHPILASRTFYVDDPMGNEVEFISEATGFERLPHPD